MQELTERIRVNAKQKASGEWYFEATFEDEAANVAVDEAGKRLLEGVVRVQEAFVGAGKAIVDDSVRKEVKK